MLSGMAQCNLQNPEAAWMRTREINDPVRRRQAFDDMAYRLTFPQPSTKPSPVSDLLQLPEVPEEYKKPWLGL